MPLDVHIMLPAEARLLPACLVFTSMCRESAHVVTSSVLENIRQGCDVTIASSMATMSGHSWLGIQSKRDLVLEVCRVQSHC